MEEKKEDVVKSNNSVGNTIKQDDNSDIFITEDNTLELTVKYNQKGNGLSVEKIDDDFVESSETKKITVTVKYPSQGDYDVIAGAFNRRPNESKDLEVKDILRMEFCRLMVLIRKWSLPRSCTPDNLMQLHPRIIKAIIIELREKMGMDGIF